MALPSFGDCVENAQRMLKFAEDETDLMKMERLEKLADSWMALAHIIRQADNLSCSHEYDAV